MLLAECLRWTRWLNELLPELHGKLEPLEGVITNLVHFSGPLHSHFFISPVFSSYPVPIPALFSRDIASYGNNFRVRLGILMSNSTEGKKEWLMDQADLCKILTAGAIHVQPFTQDVKYISSSFSTIISSTPTKAAVRNRESSKILLDPKSKNPTSRFHSWKYVIVGNVHYLPIHNKNVCLTFKKVIVINIILIIQYRYVVCYP